MKKSMLKEYILKKNIIYYNFLFKTLNRVLDKIANTKKSNKGF
jgi:hypothetical protein